MEYVYSKGNQFENPQKYSLTQFEGKDFLFSYFKSRQQITENLDSNSFNLKDFVFKKSKNIIKNDLTIDSNSFLCKILHNILIDSINDQTISDIQKLLKKFELSKKIFTSYDTTFNLHSDSFDHMTNYMLFSIILNYLFQKFNNLKFINCCLKINDLIISQLSNIKNLDDICLLKISLELETISIRKILIDKGIKL